MVADLDVALLYPWTGLPAADRGAARRVIPLISLLSEHSRSVFVLSPGVQADRRQGNVRFAFHRPRPLERILLSAAFRVYDGVSHHVCRGKVSARERRQLWHYWQAGLQPSLSRCIREAVSQSRVVFLEYPFWFRQVRRCAGRRPVILTLHDVLSEMISHPLLKKLVWQREIEACKGASKVVCVSDADRVRLGAAGIMATVVPHGVNLAAPVPTSSVSRPDLRSIGQHRSNNGRVCFFVGSSLGPNQQAVTAIRNMARQLKDERALLFVVAGSCCAIERVEPNMICTGPVSESDLTYLYDQAEIILSPVLSGTGASTKVLEAMSRGKALVSTSAGLRGLEVVDGRDCVVCDQLDAYPPLLLRMFRDPAWLRTLQIGATSFAQSYDYRKVYEPYLETLKSASMEPRVTVGRGNGY